MKGINMRYVITDTRINYVDDNNSTLAEITFPEVSDGVYEINHTFVDDSLRGQGIAGRLVKMAAEQINRNCGRVTASWSKKKKWIDKNGIITLATNETVAAASGTTHAPTESTVSEKPGSFSFLYAVIPIAAAVLIAAVLIITVRIKKKIELSNPVTKDEDESENADKNIDVDDNKKEEEKEK